MNKTDTSQIVDPTTEQPLTGPTLAFLQAANFEMIDGIVRNMVGNTWAINVPYAIYGAARGSSVSATIGEGFISFGKELFYFAGINTYTGFSNTGVFVITQTDAGGPFNPITFTDGTLRNPNKVRRVLLLDQPNGTGDFNYTSVIYINKGIKGALSPADFTSGSTSQTAITGAVFTSPASGTRKYVITFTCDVSIVTGSPPQGVLIEIIDNTGPTVLGKRNINFGASIGNIVVDVTAIGIATALAPSSVIQAYVTSNGTFNDDLKNIKMIVQEYF